MFSSLGVYTLNPDSTNLGEGQGDFRKEVEQAEREAVSAALAALEASREGQAWLASRRAAQRRLASRPLQSVLGSHSAPTTLAPNAVAQQPGPLFGSAVSKSYSAARPHGAGGSASVALEPLSAPDPAATLPSFGFVIGGDECRRGFRNGLAVHVGEYLVAPELGVQIHFIRNGHTRHHHECPSSPASDLYFRE